MAHWKTDIGNDSERNYALIIEIVEGENWAGRIERSAEGELNLCIYPSSDMVRIPAKGSVSV